MTVYPEPPGNAFDAFTGVDWGGLLDLFNGLTRWEPMKNKKKNDWEVGTQQETPQTLDNKTTEMVLTESEQKLLANIRSWPKGLQE